VFACSGCSIAGRLAYDLAQELDRRGIAEMSCLAGVGAAKSHFLKQLRGREVWIIDGCPIECGLGVFERLRRRADVHIRLHDSGVQKNVGARPGFDMEHLLDAALKQVTEQRPLEQRPAAYEGRALDRPNSRTTHSPEELAHTEETTSNWPHQHLAMRALACSLASQRLY
jgi:uncharacterized metal-binding protein